MAERKVIKPRTCTNCGGKIVTSAKGIKDHELKCKEVTKNG